ncbi:hypothetical protein JRO89_XSUnG0046900 [Xanthoceras sorbifolium]|uniref:Cytochrome P450 n=1 Tax=Xanthoceras sorbifolium TaxID=99658 RepID=A0ABQ8GZW9_9ROSI|nr:hypothetical protein JRO89_XSUnG0046900 [Xanthoceras sorbifolium]
MQYQEYFPQVGLLQKYIILVVLLSLLVSAEKEAEKGVVVGMNSHPPTTQMLGKQNQKPQQQQQQRLRHSLDGLFSSKRRVPNASDPLHNHKDALLHIKIELLFLHPGLLVRQLKLAMENLSNYLVLILFIFFVIKLVLTRHRSLPPSPFALPIIGHLHLIKKPLHQALESLLAQHGPILYLRFGCRPLLVLSSPSAVEECFTSNDITFANRPQSMAGEYFTYNYSAFVWAPYGHVWRSLRRFTVVEIFSSNALHNSSSTLQTEVRHLLRRVFRSSASHGGGGDRKVELKTLFSLLTINLMTRMVAGRPGTEDEATELEVEKKFLAEFKETFFPSLSMNVCDFFPILRLIGFGGIEKSFVRLRKMRDGYLQRLIDEIRLKKNCCSMKKVGEKKMPLIETLLSLQQSEPEFYTDEVKSLQVTNIFRFICGVYEFNIHGVKCIDPVSLVNKLPLQLLFDSIFYNGALIPIINFEPLLQASFDRTRQKFGINLMLLEVIALMELPDSGNNINHLGMGNVTPTESSRGNAEVHAKAWLNYSLNFRCSWYQYFSSINVWKCNNQREPLIDPMPVVWVMASISICILILLITMLSITHEVVVPDTSAFTRDQGIGSITSSELSTGYAEVEITSEKVFTMDALHYLGLLVSVLFIVYQFSANRRNQHKNLPPSPPSIPIIGHFHLLKMPIHQALNNLSNKYGPILLLHLGSRPTLILSSRSAIEECFPNNDIIFSNRPLLPSRKCLEYNYTTLGAPYGNHWRNIRRFFVIEIFSERRLQISSEIRTEEIRFMIKHLYKNSFKGVRKVDVKTFFYYLAFNIVMKLVTGKRCFEAEELDSEKSKKQLADLVEMFGPMLTMALGDYFPFLRWLTYYGTERKLLKIHKRKDAFIQSLLDAHQNTSSLTSVDGQKTSQTIIDVMLKLQESEPEFYTNDVIKGIIQAMLIAGTHTTTVTMERVVSQLISHPDVIQNARNEIDNNVGHSRLINDIDLAKFSYLHCIINETLRLSWGVLPPRESSEECTCFEWEDARDESQGPSKTNLNMPENTSAEIVFRPREALTEVDSVFHMLNYGIYLNGESLKSEPEFYTNCDCWNYTVKVDQMERSKNDARKRKTEAESIATCEQRDHQRDHGTARCARDEGGANAPKPENSTERRERQRARKKRKKKRERREKRKEEERKKKKEKEEEEEGKREKKVWVKEKGKRERKKKIVKPRFDERKTVSSTAPILIAIDNYYVPPHGFVQGQGDTYLLRIRPEGWEPRTFLRIRSWDRELCTSLGSVPTVLE